jgi:hypothetical protein
MESTYGIEMPGWSTWTAPSATGGAAYTPSSSAGSGLLNVIPFVGGIINWFLSAAHEESVQKVATTAYGIYQGIQTYQLQKDTLNQQISSRNAEIAASVKIAQIAANAQAEAARFQRPMISESAAPGQAVESAGMSPMWMIGLVVLAILMMRK